MKKIYTTRLFPMWKYKVLLLGVMYMALTASVAGAGPKSDTATKKDSCCNSQAAAKDTPARKTLPGDDVNATLVVELNRFGSTNQNLVALSDENLTNHLLTASLDEFAASKSSDCDDWTNLQANIGALAQHSARTGVHAVEVADKALQQQFRDAFTLDIPRENEAKLLIQSDNAMNQSFARQYGMELVSISE